MFDVIRKYIAKKYRVIKNFVTSLSSKLCFWKSKEEILIAPCVGDIIEFEDGRRSIVMSVDIKDEMYEVRFSKSFIETINQRGRKRFVMGVSKSPEIWPPENALVYRDSSLIIPQKNWRINFVVWFSKLILKK